MRENSLSSALITSNLKTRLIGQRVIYYPRLTSTMDVARRKARQGAVEGTTVVTGEQIMGRGRLKRTWLSPKGNISLSIILYPSVDYLTFLVMLASLAVVHSIRTVTGLKAQVKWPNDVLINGKKVAGILIESEVQGSKVNHAIIGIGVNVNLRPSDFPDILPGATSLSNELGREVSCLELTQKLLGEIERLYLTPSSGGSIFEEWRDSLVTLGRRVQVKSGKTIYEGIAESVARDGCLLLRHSDGSLTKIVTGDATLRS